MKQGLTIIFPGTGYTCKQPLLVKCAEVYQAMDYDVIGLDFSSIPFSNIETVEEAFELTKPIILNQLADIQISDYLDVVFISKSFGTICAGWLEGYLNFSPRQLFLTPIKETLSFIKDTTVIIGMVIGTEDKLMDYMFLREYCIKKNAECIICEGVGHSLILENHPERTEEINEQIYALCQRG